MKKYTKEITVLLSLVTAGVIGGSVYAADISETRTAGEAVVNQPEETELVLGGMMKYETTDTDNTTPEVGVAMPETSCTDNEITPTMGDVMPVTDDTDKYGKETEITPTMGVVMPVTKCTDKYCEETEITPTMGVIMPVTRDTEEPEVTHTMGVAISVTSDNKPVSTVPVSTTPPVTSPHQNAPVKGRGDIDGSGQTDLSDLIILSQYLLKDIKLDENKLIEADITKDGAVDITDLPAMKMKIMIPEGSDKDKNPPSTDDKDTHNVTQPVTDNGDSDQTEVPVTDRSYATIGLDHGPDKTVYKIGEPLDLSGTVVSACGHSSQGPYWDIFSHPVTLDDTMVKVDASSFNNQVPGTYVIIISCKEAPVSTSFTVTVTE